MALLALGAALLAAAPASATDSGAGLLGRPAPAFRFERWSRGGPLSLESLRGKVVLVRWWTDGCHYCAATLPALETLRERHGRDGLVVIGAYHPKPPREVKDRKVLAYADKLGFSGPIAVDREWSTLDRYWLGGHPERTWTSVSFLIDRAGVIRWLHGGGEYHLSSDPEHARCDREYRELEQALRTALAELEAAP
jgi:thiol-disulfide isomerase/thioredoxin